MVTFPLTASGGASATLSWKKVKGASRYRVLRDTIMLAVIRQLSYVDPAPPGTHAYSVIAVRADGKIAGRSTVAVVNVGLPVEWAWVGGLSAER